MLVFPNCKINLGLHVINKRPDSYHTIQTVFYPVNWCDILEIIENEGSSQPFLFSSTGLRIEGELEQNLIFRAWQLMTRSRKIPPVKVHLHKNIPMGAGLGGGSSDAAHFINLLNDSFNMGYSLDEKLAFAASLGSDSAFFIRNIAAFAGGTGNEFSETSVDLAGYHILLVYPGIHSNTRTAYEGLIPRKPATDLREIFKNHEPGDWKNRLVNDFEPSIFKKYPEIKSLKEKLYEAGAIYASMSGSGSSVFGIFNNEPSIVFPSNYNYFLQKPGVKIL